MTASMCFHYELVQFRQQVRAVHDVFYSTLSVVTFGPVLQSIFQAKIEHIRENSLMLSADWIPTRAQWLCLFVFLDLILSLILQ